ncbi:hypothetical protein MSAN_00810100 [Mycena sanguinolenta]|uniref:DUF6533 domain-containing protein n=1 Tax=Mycena sanguinolenta TaxID=230812 RepID=A0A8H6YYD4_9AGAR|nr:hypothetical protein MSAN_00810100 [Mycena sanguinolenta]
MTPTFQKQEICPKSALSVPQASTCTVCSSFHKAVGSDAPTITTRRPGIFKVCNTSPAMNEDTIMYYDQVVRVRNLSILRTDIILPLAMLQYMDVASVAILVFDYALTFELEVSLIWRSEWSLPKVLFLLSRYSTVFDVPLVLYFGITPVISVQRCYKLHAAITWGTVFGIYVAQAILILRTYALSDRRRSVLITFISIWVASLSATIVIIALFVKSSIYLPGITGCFLAVVDRAYIVPPYAIVLMYDTVIMAYTLYLGIRHYRHSMRTPLLVTLYRDGITYYLFLLIISLLNLFMLLNAYGTSPSKQALAQLFNTFLRVMHSVLSTRIILQIRAAGLEQLESESELPSSDEGIRFKARPAEAEEL